MSSEERKEKRRDVAMFANMLKDLMNEPMDDPLTTLDRDLQHFIYGRISVLVKHNDGKPLGSLADIGTVVGAALANVVVEFTRDRVEGEKLDLAFSTVRENLLRGFNARTPVYTPTEEELKAELEKEVAGSQETKSEEASQ